MNHPTLLVCIAVLVAGCKTLPNTGYNSLATRSDAKPLEEITPAPKISIQLGAFEKQSLTMNDQALSYLEPKSNKRLTSLYKTFRVDIREKGKYQLTVESLCDCFGYSKLIFDPLIEVRDSKNAKLTVELVSSALLQPTFSLPVRLAKTWQLEVNEPSVFSIFVYSDNYNLNKLLGEDSSLAIVNTNMGGVPVPVEYTFTSTLQGKFRLKVERTTF